MGHTKLEIYDPEIGPDFHMKQDLLCEPILKICFSEAKGTIHTLASILNKLFSNDETTKLTTHILNRAKLFHELAITNQTMADKSRAVRMNGHNFFKSNIGYSTISFDRQSLHYNGKQIYDNLDFVDSAIQLPPIIANITLFSQ